MAFSTEFKVGFFTIFGLSTLFGTGFMLEGTAFFKHKDDFSSNLDNAAGVGERTPVRVSGVQVGSVTKITVEKHGATIQYEVDSDVPIPSDSHLEIKSRGMLGDVYLEIERGNSPTYFASGAIIPVEGDAGDIQKLIANMNSIAGDVKKITASLSEALEGEGENNIKSMIRNMEQTAARIANLVETNDTKISTIIDDLSVFTAQLKELSTDDNRKKVTNIINNIDESSKDLKNLLNKVEKGEGTLGQLLVKDDTANEIKKTLTDIQSTVNPFSGLHIGLEDRFEYRYTNAKDNARVQNQFNVIIQTVPDRYYLAGIVNGPYGRKVTDTTTNIDGTTVTEQTNTTENTWLWKFNFQVSQRLTFLRANFLGVRVGFFRSTPGVALDIYTPRNMFVASAELYDINGFPMASDPTYGKRGPLNLKLYGNLYLTPHIYLTAGVDGLVLYKAPWALVGAGVYFTDQDIKGLFSSKSLDSSNSPDIPQLKKSPK